MRSKNIVFVAEVLLVVFLLVFASCIVSGFVRVSIPFVERRDFNVDSGYKLFLSDGVKSFFVDNFNVYNEYGVCLDEFSHGDYVFNISSVSGFVVGGNRSVSFFCGSIGELHSHPSGDCLASNGDILAWKDEVKRGVVLFMVQCSPHRFVVYTQEDFSQGYVYEI